MGFINGFTLKLTAAAAMLTDHIGAALFPDVIWLRIVGRIAFPIFAFLICEGCLHTRDIRRYALRLGVFALISELPFNLLSGGTPLNPDAQNVFLTLLLGVLAIYGIRRGGYAAALLPAAGMLAAELLRSDYGAFGVATIVLLYLLRSRRSVAMISLVAVNLLVGALSLRQGYMPIQAFAGAASLPLFFYDGSRGLAPAGVVTKYLFYAFYPLHIAALMLIKYTA